MNLTIIKLLFIGILTGVVASFVGGGAEILIVPLLIFFGIFKDYKSAVGTSLASLLLPIGIVAVYFYSKEKCNNKSCVNWYYALIISLSFVLGTFATYYSVKINEEKFKKAFGLLIILLGLLIVVKC